MFAIINVINQLVKYGDIYSFFCFFCLPYSPGVSRLLHILNVAILLFYCIFDQINAALVNIMP